MALPAAGLVAVTGVSGSGKSSLLFDVIEPSVRAGAPVQCDGRARASEGAYGPRGLRAGPAARAAPTEASTVVTALGLMGAVQSLFAAEAGGERASPAGPSPSPARRAAVPACRGSGTGARSPWTSWRTSIFLARIVRGCDIDPRSSAFGGRAGRSRTSWPPRRRSSAPRWSARPSGASSSAASRASGAWGSATWRSDAPSGSCRAVRSSASPSPLASSPGAAPPCTCWTSPPPACTRRTCGGWSRSCATSRTGGDLILMAEHRLSLIAACDHVIDLGPSSGAGGGSLMASGPPDCLADGATAAALRRR